MKGKDKSLSKNMKRGLSLISVFILVYIPIELIFHVNIYIDITTIVAIIALFLLGFIGIKYLKEQGFSNRNSRPVRWQNKFKPYLKNLGNREGNLVLRKYRKK